MNKKKLTHLVGISVLVCSIWLPASIEFSNTRIRATTEITEELVDEPEEMEESQFVVRPQFSFSETQVMNQLNEVIQIKVISDLPTTEVTVKLPSEAKVEQEFFSGGEEMIQGEVEGQWLLRYPAETAEFDFSLSFDKPGEYPVAIVSEEYFDSEMMIVVEEEVEDEEQVTEDIKVDEIAVLPEGDTNEANFQEKQFDDTTLARSTTEVTTFDQLRLAIANSEISQIEVMNNLVRSGTGIATAIGSLNRDLTINGNGYSITFGADNGSLNLARLADEETATLQIKNASLTKSGATSIFNAVGTGQGWTVELENITELTANASRLATIPQGKVAFTGGINVFNRSALTNIFIESKDVEVRGGARVTITRGNATILYSAVTIENPSIKVIDGSSLVINTSGGTSNAVDYRGNNPLIEVSKESSLAIQTVGSTGTPLNTSNNVVALSGTAPKISVSEESKFNVTTTLGKRGLHLSGNNAEINVSDSEFFVTSATQAAVNLVGDNSSITIKNSNSQISSTTGTTMVLTGLTPKVNYEGSTASLTSTIGQRLNLVGNTPSFILTNTEFTMNATTGRGIYLQGTTPQVLLDNSELKLTDTGATQGMILQGADARLSLDNQSSFTVTGAGTGTLENIQIGNNNARPSFLLNHGSKLTVNTPSGTADATGTTNNAIHVGGVESKISIENESSVDINISSGAKRGFVLSQPNGTFQIMTASQLTVETQQGNSIHFAESDYKFLISGARTQMFLSSDYRSFENDKATFYLGRGFIDNNSELVISEKSLVDVKANQSSAIGIGGYGNKFIAEKNSKVRVHSGIATAQPGSNTTVAANAAATVRFRSAGDSLFLIDNSDFEITKEGGNAPALRLFGDRNRVSVINGGHFKIDNPGDGTPHDGNLGGGNQGVHLVHGNDTEFSVSGRGSKIEITAESGPALDLSGIGKVIANDQAVFIADGKTVTTSGAIIRAASVEVDFNNPLFMDFRNNRPGGGQIFNTGNNSILDATNSDLSLWRIGSNLDEDPQVNLTNIDYNLSGANFSVITSTNAPDEFNSTVFGANGLAGYARLSSNNGQAKVDELRVPTDADKFIYGHASVMVGVDDDRSAWTNEVKVEIEIERADGTIDTYFGRTIGAHEEDDGLSVYGEAPRPGLFEIALEDYLKDGDKVRVVGAERGEIRPRPSLEEEILVDEIATVPVVPPMPAEFSSSNVGSNAQSILGTSENPEVTVEATHNGTPIDTSGVLVNDEGNFSIPVSGIDLKDEDKIQVFLRDKKGSAGDAGVINPPTTNNEQGNINPTTELTFHDRTFEVGTVLTVLGDMDVVDPLNPEIEIAPENKPEIPEKQGLLSLDFVSQFNFGEQAISLKEETYYAKPQRLLNEDGTVNEEERPNFVQVSDRRPDNEREGWQLSVLQDAQFTSEDHELTGAQLQLANQQLATVHGGVEPEVTINNLVTLIPGSRRVLLTAQGEEGKGTWIYRFGNEDTARDSIQLNVPKGTNPESAKYTTTLNWELSAVPGN